MTTTAIRSWKLKDLLMERLNILIKLNDGPKRRQLLRLKAQNQLEIEAHLWATNEAVDDLTLCLMENAVQLPSTKITDALKSLAPTIFVDVTDWSFLDNALEQMEDAVGLAPIRDCIARWIHSVRKMNRSPDDTSTSSLFSFSPELDGLRKIVETLDDLSW